MICKLCGANVPASSIKQKTLLVYVNIDHKGLNITDMLIGTVTLNLCRECLRQRPKKVKGKLIF